MFFLKFRQFLGIEMVAVSTTERLLAAIGGGLSILILVGSAFWAFPEAGATAVITSMGASAVLLFAVPHGQLSQPWPVLAGHGFSAIIGVACARYIQPLPLAAACAVGLAILVMHQFKCIHPPGGATAFAAVMGGSAIRQLGLRFVLFPVLTNALVMVTLAVLFSRAFPWRRYPVSWHGKAPKPLTATGTTPTHAEVVAAIKSIDSFVDISEEDLLRLTEILSQRG